MKEYPVIRFLPDLFARVLDGSKTQTRRLSEKWASVKPVDLLWAEEDGTGRRVLIEATDNRRQHLQEITEEDAKAEGCSMNYDGPYSFSQGFNYRGGFMVLWDSINGKRAPWSANPEVSAITFRRVP